jgi:transposase
MRKLTPDERRELVSRGVNEGKSNRAIAKELDVDEGTVRRDIKFLDTPEHERPVKKERPKKPQKPQKIRPAYDPDDAASLELHVGRMLKVLKAWIVEEGVLITEIEDILHGASKHLYLQRDSLRERIQVPTQSPKDLISLARPTPLSEDELIPSPDYWARWMARWLAICLPGQEELQKRVFEEVSLWARSL